MRYGIISDVHANPAALQAVFRHARGRVSAWWFLGDAVGYGPCPVETLRLLRQKVKLERWLLGNHDAMLVGLLRLSHANQVAGDADHTLEDHERRLSLEDPDLRAWCQKNWTAEQAAPRRLRSPGLNIWFVHGIIPEFHWDEAVTEYIHPFPNPNGLDNTWVAFKRLRERYRKGAPNLLIHGHTHVPYAMGYPKGDVNPVRLPVLFCNQPLNLNKFDLLLINPGSVGLPRNPDPESHAAYGILDTTRKTFEFQRVLYESEPIQKEMDDRGYPKDLKLHLRGAGRDHPFWGAGKNNKRNWAWNEWEQIYSWDCNRGWILKDEEQHLG